MTNTSSNPVTIAIPVYGDWSSLADCIESLKQHVKFKDGHIVMLVNDCGPDADMIENNILKAIKGHKDFHYYRNDHNLGFVGTCNRAALEIDQTDNEILLLNSDTIVTLGFLEELVGTLNTHEKIGAVSPRTNNATIATIPISEIKNKGISPSESYVLYNKVKDMLPKYSITPVAHGFCMLIRRTCIKKYGLFDPIFGKGYGEETDFSMRINTHGYLSVLSNWSFVYHMEARSFTLATKNKLLEQNSKIMWERYPFYREAVRNYLDNDIDIVDRFTHLIGSYGPAKNLIDLRGFHNITDKKQRVIITSRIKSFVKTAKGSVAYLIDGPPPEEITIDSNTIVSMRGMKDTYNFAFRPFDFPSLKDIFILNRHALKVLVSIDDIDSLFSVANVDNNSKRRALLREIFLLSDGLFVEAKLNEKLAAQFKGQETIPPTYSNCADAYGKIIAQPVVSSKLHLRWNHFHAIEVLRTVESRPEKNSSITRIVKKILSRNKHVLNLARKTKKLIG